MFWFKCTQRIVTSCLLNLNVGRSDEQRGPNFTCSSNSGERSRETRVNKFYALISQTLNNIPKSSELTFKQKLFLRSPSPPTPTSLLELLKVDHHLQHLHLQLIHLVDCLLSPGIALLQSHQGLQQLPVGLPVKTLEKKINVWKWGVVLCKQW